MSRHSAFRSIPSGLVAAVLIMVCVGYAAHAQQGGTPAPSLKNNFGFPVAFSVAKMDRTADPRTNFTRYAAGRWLDAATIPKEELQVSAFHLLSSAVETQLAAILTEASRAGATAPKGSPAQLVGDFYASGMDEQHLTALGTAPLQAEFGGIAAAKTPKALAEVSARLLLRTTEPFLVGVQVGSDLTDRTRNTIYAGDGDLPIGVANYLSPDMQPIRDAYQASVAEMFELAGNSSEQARAKAATILAIETRVARKKMSAVDKMDPNKRFVRMSYADLKRLLSNFDLDTLLTTLGLPTGQDMIVVEVEAQRERNAMLAELPWADTQTYFQWEFLRQAAPYLSPAFAVPGRRFNATMMGETAAPPRDRVVGTRVPKLLGHPLSKLYVEKHFSAETKRAVDDLIGRVRKEFRGRVERNTWLTPETRAHALEKADKTDIRVGYPTTWIDYSSVDVRRDDYFGNVMRLNEFTMRRALARFGKPVNDDEFSMPGKTLPIDINAAYDSSKNGIEIPAAFLQPPFYAPASDAAVNYCTLGAVIGHEITHGFDSGGRNFDEAGRLRDWWTEADATQFVAEARKLVTQANAFEALPGLRLNGAVEVMENLADVGGVALGYAALRTYLREHPEAAKPIEGFTPDQRCFLAWGQLWAEKTAEGALRQTIPTEGHAPGSYRIFAPLQHEKGFFSAFGIRPGDPMWLDEKSRVAIW